MDRTPEETKKGLECCSADECHGQHTDCHYHPDLMCIRNICADVLALIQQLEAKVPRWISVEESLPKRYEHVLVTTRFTDEGEPSFAIAYLALSGWKKEKGILYGKVTHWMPLPEPPKD